MSRIFSLLVLLITTKTFAQKYEPTWESLDKRQVLEWYTDAKFGIFVHWGVYSVPALAEKGAYAEWYQNALNGPGSKTAEYHKEKYGEL